MESVPFFGMFAPCRASQTGSHDSLEHIVVEADDTLAASLHAVYNAVPSFDRAAFDRYASPELKQLLRKR